MSFRDELARVIANDPRYSIEAYAFILEALNQARQLKLKGLGSRSGRTRRCEVIRSRRRLQPESVRKAACLGPCRRRRALRRCPKTRASPVRTARPRRVLAHWGVHSTSDIGEIVYNLIAAGDLEKTESDSRSDFDNLFDFETAFKAPSSPPAADRSPKAAGNPDPPVE